MAAISQDKWRIGATATSLLVAYLLILQGVVVSFASLGGGAQAAEGGFSGGVFCASEERAVTPDGKTLPRRSQRHGETCCLVHCSSAGAPPSAEMFSPRRPWLAQASYFARAAEPRAPRPLLPLGSRAPPARVV
jgi:hypothetical protein